MRYRYSQLTKWPLQAASLEKLQLDRAANRRFPCYSQSGGPQVKQHGDTAFSNAPIRWRARMDTLTTASGLSGSRRTSSRLSSRMWSKLDSLAPRPKFLNENLAPTRSGSYSASDLGG